MEEQQQGPSLPSNYVSFLQLKERWLQQHTPQSTHDSAPTNQPKSPAFKIANKSGKNGLSQQVTKRDSGSGSNQAAGINCNRVLKPEVTMHDASSSKTTVVDNRKQQEQNTLQSKSKRSTKKKGPNPSFVTDPNQTAHSTPEPEPPKENKHRYKGGRRNWNPRLVTEKNQTGGSTPELEPEPVQEEKLRDNGGQRKRNPRFVTDHNQTARGTPEPEPEPEPVQEKKHPRYDGDRRNRNPNFLEPVPEKKQHGFNGGRRNRNPKFSTDQNQTGGSSPELEPEPVQEEKLHDNVGHRKRNPRFVTDHNQTARSTPEPEPEPVQEKKQPRYDGDRRNRNPRFLEPVPEKKQHGFNGGGRNRNPKFSTDQNQTGGSSPEKKHQRNRKQEVREPKGKTEPIAQDDYSGFVKEVNVSRNTNGGYGSGRFQTNRPARPHFPGRKVQMTAVWVKRGESVPN